MRKKYFNLCRQFKAEIVLKSLLQPGLHLDGEGLQNVLNDTFNGLPDNHRCSKTRSFC